MASPTTSFSSTASTPSPKTFVLNASRQVVSRKFAEQLFPPLGDHRYTTIKLSGCALGDAAASVAGPYLVMLANKKCLETVIFSDIIASLDPQEALRSLSTLANSVGMWKGIKSVDVSCNSLGSLGIASCAALFQRQTALEQIFLAHAGLAAESARLLVSYLSSTLSTSLRVLDVHANRMESAGLIQIASIVAKSPNLHRLRVSSLGASPDATCKLAKALATTSVLTELDISDNALDIAGATELAAVLTRQTHLTRLALNDLSLTDDALNALLIPLCTAQFPLSDLLLARNELTSESASAIAMYIEAHKTDLRVLNLNENELGDVGISKLVQAVKNSGAESALTKISIAKNSVTSVPVVKFAQELVKLPGMRRYDVAENPISDTVVEALHAAFGPGVVVYEPNIEERVVNEQSDNLDSALQSLADMADVVERPVVSPSPSSAQSRSTVSRLVSLFSRGSEESSSFAPSTRVEAVSDSNAMNTATSNVMPDNDDVVTSLSGFETPRFQRRTARRSVTSMATTAATDTSTAITTPGEGTTMPTASALEASPASTVYMTPGSSSVQDENITRSAQKLRESVARLNQELTDVTGELKSSGLSSSHSEIYSKGGEFGDEEDLSRYLLVPSLPQDQQKISTLDFLADVLGGFMLAVFVVVLVLAIARSQEDSTFAYRPV